MIYINHRVNTIAQLKKVPTQNGIELDVRYHGNELVLHHDPFHHHETHPQQLEHLLQEWNHDGPIILNIKTEGIERACIDLMNKYNIDNWFFLDLSMPFFVLYATHASNHEIQGFSPENLAVRFSEYEPIEYALSFANKVKWVWVDCFTHLPVDRGVYSAFIEAGFSLCLVSPELQQHSMARIAEFQAQCEGLEIAMVCTKRPDLWGQQLPPATLQQLKEDYPVT